MNEAGERQPFSEEAEKGVLGSIIIQPEESLDACIQGGLTTLDFFLPAHQILITEIGNMVAGQEKVDILTLTERLKRNGKIKAIGGERYLEDLIDATPTTAHTEHYVQIIRAHSKRRRIKAVCENGTAQSRLTDDPEALRAELEAEFAGMEGKTAKKSVEAIFNDILSDARKAANGEPVEIGVPTGIRGLDDLCEGGMRVGVYWLSGMEGTGKTSMKNNIIDNFIRRGDAVADLTLEMSIRDELERLTSIHLGCSVPRVLRGKSHLPPGKLEQAKQELLGGGLLHMADQSDVASTVELMSWAKRMVTKHNVKLICIDYFQRLEVPNEHDLNLETATSRKSAAITSVANLLQIPILCLAAINDQGKVRGSRMADYDGAGHWRLEAQDTGGSDAVPPYYDRPVDLVTQKARFGVPFKRLGFMLRGVTGEFTEREYQGNGSDDDL